MIETIPPATCTTMHRGGCHCGIKSFYVPRSNPDGISINARCLDGIEPDALEIVPFDDNDRDAATAAIEHLSKD